MALPAGAVSRAAGTINHFFTGPIDPVFAETFFRRQATVRDWIKRQFHVVNMPGAYAVFHLWGQTALPGPADRGEGVIDAGFDEFTMTAAPLIYRTKRVPIHEHDKKDSNAPKGIETVAEEQAKILAAYLEYVYAELLEGSASTFLHRDTSFVNKFGGTGLYSTTHSFSGQTLSNIVTQTGVTANSIIDDFWSAVTARRTMPDSNGQPLHGLDSEVDITCDVVVPKALEQVMNQVWRSELLLQGGATAPSSNYTKQHFAGKIEWHVWERLSNTSRIHLSFTADGRRPLGYSAKDAIERETWEKSISDWSKATGQSGYRHVTRKAHIIGDVECAIRIGA